MNGVKRTEINHGIGSGTYQAWEWYTLVQDAETLSHLVPWRHINDFQGSHSIMFRLSEPSALASFDFVRLSWLGKLDSAAPPLTSGPVPVPCRALPCPCPEYLACLFCMDCITLQTSSLKNTAYLDGTTLAFSLPNEKEFSYYMLLLISTNSSKKSSKIKHIYICFNL